MLIAEGWQQLFQPEQLKLVIGLLIACLIPIAGIVAHYWYKAQKMHSDNELKRTLAERGMSADEIERVVNAKPKDPDASS
ncbi:MAG: hypothetical protein JXO22_08610 [Phycisphaerae bacterium]|nr:hypothetical protein [Phycisphaerae bacterium]